MLRWRRTSSGRRTKQTSEIRAIIEEAMRKDDETTAVQLCASLNIILLCRKSLGWTFRGSAYCQMIRETNKA